LGGVSFKRGIPRASASIYFSDGDLPHIEIQAYRDAEGAPCIRIEARIPGNPLFHVFYDGPLSKRILQPAPRCLECEDRGWAIFNEAPKEGYLGEVQACDCGLLPSDEEALEAARSAGWSVSDSYQILVVPTSR